MDSKEAAEKFMSELEKKRKEWKGEGKVRADPQPDTIKEGHWYYEDGDYVLEKPDQKEAYVVSYDVETPKGLLDWMEHLSQKPAHITNAELGEFVRLVRKIQGIPVPRGD